jgi:uncharacterized membrane protein YedE/YeeE
MPAADLATLSRAVLAATFVLAFAFGAIAQRTGFCTMGSVADVVSFGDWTRMRQWLLAIAVAIGGTTLLDAMGLIDVRHSFYTSERFTPLAYVVGGLMFGFGMVLAGGCGSRSLVRAGAGNLKSVIVLLVLGVVAYITLRGGLALVRVGVLEQVSVTLAGRQDLPSLLADSAGARGAWQVGIGLALAGTLAWFVLRDRAFWSFDNLLAGVGIGGVIVAAWFVSGYLGYIDEHPLTLEPTFLRTNSRQMESLSFVAPVAWSLDYLMFMSDASKQLTIGIVAVAGVLCGSAVHALATGRYRWEGFRDTEDTANHLAGGALMGFGGVTALGCTIGQGLSGVSTLAAGSFIALAGIVAGAVLGVRYQAWRIDRRAG